MAENTDSLRGLIQNAEAHVTAETGRPIKPKQPQHTLMYLMLILLFISVGSAIYRYQNLHEYPTDTAVKVGHSVLMTLMADEVLAYQSKHGHLPAALPSVIGLELGVIYHMTSDAGFELYIESAPSTKMHYESGELIEPQ